MDVAVPQASLNDVLGHPGEKQCSRVSVPEPVGSPSRGQERVPALEPFDPVVDRLWPERPAELASVEVHEDRRVILDVEAKLDDANDQKLAKLTSAQIDLEHQHMAQALLADRFHLKAHWEDRRGETYDLVVAKPGKMSSTGPAPTAEELKDFGTHPIPPLYQSGDGVRGYEYIAHGASTADIASMLTMQFGKPVTDKTGLTGKYYFDLKYHNLFADDHGNDDPTSGPRWIPPSTTS